MIKYGLLLGVVGTFMCVTAVSPSLPTPCPKEVKQVCGTDGVTYNNFCLLDEVHTRNEKVVLSHLGSCKNESVETLANVTSRMQNTRDSVLNKTTETAEDLKDGSEEAQKLSETNDEDILNKTSDVDDGAVEEAIVTEDADVSQIDDITVNKTIPEASQEEEQAHTFEKPISETNATTETEVKNVINATSSPNATESENDQKVKIEQSKTKNDGENVTEKNGKSKVVKKSEAIRKRRDVKNFADTNGNNKDATNERKLKVSKNKSEKSKKQRNVENVSNKNGDKVKTSTDGKVEETTKIAKNKSEKSRKRRDVQNEGKVNVKHEQNQSEKKNKDAKNSKNKVTKSNKHKGTNSSHQSRKQRDVKGKDGKKHVQKTKRVDGKMKKGSQNN